MEPWQGLREMFEFLLLLFYGLDTIDTLFLVFNSLERIHDIPLRSPLLVSDLKFQTTFFGRELS